MANTRHAVAKLADDYLSDSYGSLPEVVQLVRSWPVNELDLVPHMLYEHSALSLKEIKSEVETWPIEKKTNVFQNDITYIHRIFCGI